MPNWYKRKSDRQSWDDAAVEKAVEAIKNKEMGYTKASKLYGVPRSTLRRYTKLHNDKNKHLGTKEMGRYRVFTKEMEQELVNHMKHLETKLFDFTRKEVLKLAYQFAHSNRVPHNFNNDIKMAGREWLAGFKRRNPDVKIRQLRKPASNATTTVQTFNKTQVNKFFASYQKVWTDNNISPQKLYNVDEIVLSINNQFENAFAAIARKQDGALTNDEKYSNVTAVCCMNAIGDFVPPCVIYPRKLLEPELLNEAPTGTLGIAQESGWMTPDVFHEWLAHFQKHVKASSEEKVLLVINGHYGHKGIESLKFAEEHGIVMICLPPHSAQHMQPLDAFFYKALKTHFNQELATWLEDHPDSKASHFQIGLFLNNACCKVAIVQNAVDGFRKTGLWPINPNIFPDHLFKFAAAKNILNAMKLEESDSTDEIVCTPLIDEDELNLTGTSESPSTSRTKDIVCDIPTLLQNCYGTS